MCAGNSFAMPRDARPVARSLNGLMAPIVSSRSCGPDPWTSTRAGTRPVPAGIVSVPGSRGSVDPIVVSSSAYADGSAYGLSKACANTYTAIVAREQPGLLVNACTPGFIATDMTRPYAESEGKAPAALGMKTPAEGAKAPLHLLFGAVQGSGHYYGSDAKRSPLDRYRAPGSPEYNGQTAARAR